MQGLGNTLRSGPVFKSENPNAARPAMKNHFTFSAGGQPGLDLKQGCLFRKFNKVDCKNKPLR